MSSSLPFKKILQHIAFILFTLSGVITSCSSNDIRVPGCDLDKLNLNGNITRVDIATFSDIPFSEWNYGAKEKDSPVIRWDVQRLITYIGNSTIEFKPNGYAKKNTIYNRRGEILASGIITSQKNSPSRQLYHSLCPDYSEFNCKLKQAFDECNRVVEETYYDSQGIHFVKTISYNKKGDLDIVCCRYILSDMQTDCPTDSIFFHYTDYDILGNWTAASIRCKGAIKMNDFIATVKRKITFATDEPLQEYPFDLELVQYANQLSGPTKEYQKKSINVSDLTIDIPASLKKVEDWSFGDTQFYMYLDDYYLSLSTSTTPYIFSDPIALAYSAMSDQPFNLMMAKQAYDNNIRFMSIDSRDLLCVLENNPFYHWTYYMYTSGGKGGSPIIVDNIIYQNSIKGELTTISFGYDSSHGSSNRQIVDQILNSIRKRTY